MPPPAAGSGYPLQVLASVWQVPTYKACRIAKALRVRDSSGKPGVSVASEDL
ncbi:MAG: hypothetical protein LBJ58_06340 [Tannerellaceae bacterium]|nr:hypothetical protein [Tannerellaceae bacterium]